MKSLSLISSLALISCSSGPGPVIPETKVEKQMIGLLEKFDRWDENGDGKLVPRELKEAEQRSGQPAAQMIKFYDTNHDGGISLREAQAGYSRVDEAELMAKKRKN